MAETIGTILIASVAPGAITGIGFGSAISGASFLGVSLATAVGTATILGTSIGLNYALRPDVPKPENGSHPLKQGIPPRIRGYGRNRLAGYYMLFEEADKNSYDVMAVHSGRVAAVVNMYLHDDLVVFDHGATDAIRPAFADDGRYGPAGNVRVHFGYGDGSTQSFFGVGPSGGIWDPATHFGIGIFWASLYCQGQEIKPEDYTEIYPRGLPVLSLVLDCSPVWDPRDPTQSRLDSSTWKISYNPVLQLLDYLTQVDGCMGLDFDILFPTPAHLALWMHEADLCDERVATPGDTEPRYTSNGWYQFDNKPEDIVNSILATCDGWLAEAGDGSLALKVGVYREPTVTIAANHIIDFNLNYGQADEQAVNQLNISHTDPNSGYVEVQAEPYRDEESISLTGMTRSQSLDLKWTQTETQARRLAERAMRRLNTPLSGTITTTLYGLAALGERWVRIQYPFVSGLQDSVIEIQDADIDLMAGRITFTFILVFPEILEPYDPEAGGETPVIPPSIKREDGSSLFREDGSLYIREEA
ncbi:phage tail protein [Nitrobacter winogradskyi]|uniref:Uncharacterized protein n=2 Tax=Nitrobacter winogradskyi TaxID=913 RepID=A0ACC6AEJ8_NITWI|nr:phage tail protein [Nitrobacter winogradskyi]MCP1998265.1 hypothetical protein [Nitrobacter winogradskyi]GEC15148.1 hypothetical protein NWI01_10400 [Nitrobacter winogradskyi]